MQYDSVARSIGLYCPPFIDAEDDNLNNTFKSNPAHGYNPEDLMTTEVKEKIWYHIKRS